MDRMVRRCRLAAPLAVACALIIASPAGAASIVVTTEDDPSPPPTLQCLAGIPGECSLRGAIAAAQTPIGGIDTIVVPATADTYELTNGPLSINPGASPLTIRGAGPGATVIDGNASGRVFDIAGGTVTLTGLTVANGAISGLGEFGGGVLVSGGNVVLDQVTIENNEVVVPGGAPPTGSGGAGLGITGGVVIVRDSTISGNRVEGSGNEVGPFVGGGIAVQQSTLAVTGSTVAANTVTANGEANLGSGGGIDVWDATAVITNSTIADNTVETEALAEGGGVTANVQASVAISASTIANNQAGEDADGDGGNVLAVSQNAANVAISGSILAGGRAATGPDCLQIGENGAQVANTLIETGQEENNCDLVGDGNLAGDPQLGALADNGGPTETMALSSTSPALDKITSGCPPPATDQRGLARPQGSGCDMGRVRAATARGGGHADARDRELRDAAARDDQRTAGVHLRGRDGRDRGRGRRDRRHAGGRVLDLPRSMLGQDAGPGSDMHGDGPVRARRARPAHGPAPGHDRRLPAAGRR